MTQTIKFPDDLKRPETITIPYELAAAIADALGKSLVDRAAMISFQSLVLGAAMDSDADRVKAFLDKTADKTPGAIHRSVQTLQRQRKVETEYVTLLAKAFDAANGGEVMSKLAFEIKPATPHKTVSGKALFEAIFGAAEALSAEVAAGETIPGFKIVTAGEAGAELSVLRGRLEHWRTDTSALGCSTFGNHWRRAQQLLGILTWDAKIDDLRGELQALYARRCNLIRDEVADLKRLIARYPDHSIARADYAKSLATLLVNATEIGLELPAEAPVAKAA